MKIRRTKISPAIPPIVVPELDGLTEGGWRRLADEMSHVIAIMDKLGLTEVGYKIAWRGRFDINADAIGLDRGVAERLEMAREAIREEARRDGSLWGLPNALLYKEGLAVELFGSDVPGEPRDYHSCRTIKMVKVTEAEERRWVLVA